MKEDRVVLLLADWQSKHLQGIVVANRPSLGQFCRLRGIRISLSIFVPFFSFS